MKFNSKIIADYVEMINEELDSIPINKKEEFELVASELQCIVNPSLTEKKHCFFAFFKFFLNSPSKEEASLKERLYSELSPCAKKHLDDVRYCYTTPEDFVEKKENFIEYKEIIKKRIASRINDFRSFNDQQKEEYILSQLQRKPTPLI